MPFYDAFTTSTFAAQYGRPMAVISNQNSDPAAFADECAFLPGLIGQFTDAITIFVRQTYPTARVEVLCDPEMRARIIDDIAENSVGRTADMVQRVFELGDPPNYEPLPEDSVAARAERRSNPVGLISAMLRKAFGVSVAARAANSQPSDSATMSMAPSPWAA